MTRNADIPDRSSAPKPSKLGKKGQVPGSPQVPKISPQPPTSRRVSGAPPQAVSGKQTQNFDKSPQEVNKAVPEVSTEWTEGNNNNPEPPLNKKPPQKKRLGFFRSWPFWGITIVLIFSGLGFTSVALLLKLQAVPNCPETFWPLASASLRLYCAQLAANKQTAENLLEAIALVNSLPRDHELRPEINRYIEQWSVNILDLGEEAFNDGKLEDAIAMARQIPAGAPAYDLVEKRIAQWQLIWSKAEGFYQKADAMLRQSKWHDAFTEAVRLAYIDNKYWSTTRYEQLVNQIQIAKAESGKLDKAYQLKKRGGLDNLLDAIELAQQISPSSYAYNEAKTLITECGEKLMYLAKERLDKRDWSTVLEIAKKIPSSLNLEAESQDLSDLANAQSRAEAGTVESLEEAIAQAQKLELGRPLREKAQDLIARWQREIQDIAHLQRARELAKPGTVSDLAAAVAEMQLIPRGNPRIEEAKSQINRWNYQIQTLEDRPYLERAEQIASMGDVTSLQAAVIEASQISRGRALYQEAQEQIGRWNRKIQRIQDQPVLEQAEGLASAGNLPTAVSTAKQIKPERALYDEAQTKIRSWQREIDAQSNLSQAYEAAKSDTPEGLSNAIRLARQVARSTSVSSNAREAANRWSYQILAIAQTRSESNIKEAIAIAKTVPSGTEAYESARLQIQAWEKSLQPPAPLETVPETLPTASPTVSPAP